LLTPASIEILKISYIKMKNITMRANKFTMQL
jgi:hypothetical protein